MSVARSPLVGRSGELARVSQALEAAAGGDPTFVLILGEAGIGKTAFLRATAWLAATHGLRTLTGTAIASGAAIPYLPLVAPLRAAVASMPAGDPAAARLRIALDGETDADDPGPTARAARLLEAMFEVVVGQPTLLVVDDVHWADASTLTMLDYVAHRAADERLAVIAAARDDEPGGLRGLPIADGRRFLQLPLGRLGRAAVREQVTLLTGHATPESVVDSLYARSDGNPLYVEELLHRTDAGGGGGDGAGPPSSLTGLVASRVAGLSDHARLVADALSVIGRPTDVGLAAAVAGLAEVEAARALADAAEGGVAVRRTEGHALRHPLFGEALAAQLEGTPRAAAMHRRAAEVLEAAAAGPAELSGHWAASGDTHRTWSSSLAAGNQAVANGAHAEGRGYLERAADLWPDEEHGKVDALLRAALAAWLSGDADGAVVLAARAEDDGAPPFEALLARAQYAWDTGRRDEATELFAAAAERIGSGSPPIERAQALWCLGRARIGELRPADAHDLAVEAADAAALAGSDRWQSHAWVLAGMARAWIGDITSVPHLERGVEFAKRSRDPVAIGHAYQFLAGQLFWAGRLEDAHNVGVEGARLCDRLGLARSFGSDARGVAAEALIELGRWREADLLLEHAEPRAVATFNRALLAIRRGEWEAAERDLSAAENAPSIGGPGRLGGAPAFAHAELSWLRADPERGLGHLEDVSPEPGVWGIDSAARRVWWQARLGRPSGARVVHAQPAMAAAMNADLVAIESGTDADWIAAVDAWVAMPRPYEAAIAAYQAAEAAYQRRDRSAGKGWLHMALVTASELGAAPLVARIEALAARARVVMTQAPKRHVDAASLTPREMEVLQLLAEGRTNPQIAQHLFLSPKTVSIHVQRVLEKLDAHTRGEAVAAARRRGLLA